MLKINKGKFYCYQFCYTILIVLLSSAITTWYIFNVVMSAPPLEVLRKVEDNKTITSPLLTQDTIVEMFSYGCHYCQKAEDDLKAFEKTLPNSKKLVRLHIGLNDGLGSYAPLFATLSVMGVEPALHTAAYHAVLDEGKDLSNISVRNAWLTQQGIDIATYENVARSEEVKSLLALSQQVTDEYGIHATPAYIVGRRWVTLTDREWPAMGEQLKSLLINDKPVDK